MNQRIKQLIKQAETDVSGKWVSVDNMEVFAKLIVQECAEIARLNTRVDSKVYLMIEQHFGVEEPKGWICPKCNADRTKIACPLGFGATVDGRCPMTVEAQ